MSTDAKTATQGTSLLDEVVEIANRMTRDKTRLEQICRLIAAGSPDPAAEPAAVEGPAPRRRGRRAVAKGRRKPKDTAGSWDRIVAMHGDLLTVFGEVRPGVILVEWTRGKVQRRHGGLGAGLAVYGCGVGAVGLAAHLLGLAHPDCRVEAICENEWTRGVPKQTRQLAIATEYPDYAEHLAEDPGGDMADGIGLVHWWLRERLAERRLF